MRHWARAAWLAGAAAVAGCTPSPRRVAPVAAAPAAPVCRVGPDDGPLRVERGIGGTGAPATAVAERGIGGTGIIGVITGFASVCLAGHEVALPAGVPVEIGGAAADPQALRAGHVAAVAAAGPADALTARRVTVRYEVQGPIEAVAPDRLQVAGQAVTLSAETWLRTAPALGQWVAVSGLREADGAIAATRLDLVSTRSFIVRGVLRQEAGGYRIGGLPVTAGPGDVLVPGLPVSVTGVYDDGGVRVATIAPDLLAADPVAYFGGDASSFILEGFAGSFGAVPLARPIGPGRSVVEFERGRDGAIKIDAVLPRGDPQPAPAPAPARAFEPAPMPNRALGPEPGPGGGNRAGEAGARSPGSRVPQPGAGGAGGTAAPGPGMDGGRRR